METERKIQSCKVCNGVFYEDSLKDGKCVLCERVYPLANSGEDAARQFLALKNHIFLVVEKEIKEFVEKEIKTYIENKEIPEFAEYIRKIVSKNLIRDLIKEELETLSFKINTDFNED